MTDKTDLTVANGILEQLGGSRFARMTGAKDFVGSPDALSFKLPPNFAKGGCNAVGIRLDPTDTYTMTFYKKRGLGFTTLAEVPMVYCDNCTRRCKAGTPLAGSAAMDTVTNLPALRATAYAARIARDVIDNPCTPAWLDAHHAYAKTVAASDAEEKRLAQDPATRYGDWRTPADAQRMIFGLL